MDTSKNNSKIVKDNWDDSSESEPEIEEEPNNNKVDVDVHVTESNNNNNNNIDNIEEEWEAYYGDSVCINCKKSDDQRIIMVKSKNVYCYDNCDDDDDDYYDDDYDELDDYDRKLGLSISCR